MTAPDRMWLVFLHRDPKRAKAFVDPDVASAYAAKHFSTVVEVAEFVRYDGVFETTRKIRQEFDRTSKAVAERIKKNPPPRKAKA